MLNINVGTKYARPTKYFILKFKTLTIKIFLFHRVSPDKDPLWQPMLPDRFEYIIKLIKRHYIIISIEDYFRNKVEIVNGKKYAAVTFDDGYKDFIQYALPVIAKYQIKASMYVVTDCAETGVPPWTYELDYLFNHTKKKLHLEKEYNLYNCRELKDNLKKSSNEARISCLTFVKEQLNDVAVPDNLMMNWSDVIEANNWGIEIGSHTASHPILSSMLNYQELEHQMAASFQILKSKLGHAPFTLSYPNGSYNTLVKEYAKKTGYEIALALSQKTFNSGVHDLFEIPRIELYQQSVVKSIARIFGATDYLNLTKKEKPV
jgi:peptidoglycan/xylan/chitin deacetylase (PgdA/CDA1 family)